MDAELSARTGASINQLLQWFYGQEDKKEIWECESSLRQEQFYQSHNHTRKRVCQGMLLRPGLTTITSFPQGHPGLIIHNPSSFQNKVLPY